MVKSIAVAVGWVEERNPTLISIPVVRDDSSETAMPCPYNIILGRDTALPCPNFGE
ncbi:MAG: hypothetical protein QQW96_03260 [Tychonema bourrellyi B0820]|uniref:hypothetical protein n=1 Tax=Tychonema bourrellyi TaxID=54313 RepID=UPI0015D4CE7B|nr:hypothetical protein [Tychonema bourrellyi]MDQ2096649.1 hypothetical protein [Tychonema bourrellyi B0820]